MYLFDSKFPIVQLRYVVSKGDWWCTESFKVLDDIVYIYTTYKRILPIVITFFHIIPKIVPHDFLQKLKKLKFDNMFEYGLSIYFTIIRRVFVYVELVIL